MGVGAKMGLARFGQGQWAEEGPVMAEKEMVADEADELEE